MATLASEAGHPVRENEESAMKRFSQDQNHKQLQSYRDPVCGMEVSPITAIEVYDYKHKTYYFCAAICKEAFETEPQKYVQHHRQHGLKPA